MSVLDPVFLARFEREMAVNQDSKGCWRAAMECEDTDWAYVLDELDDHVRKLKNAIQHGFGLERIREHCADIAGNAMMAHHFAGVEHARVEQLIREMEEA